MSLEQKIDDLVSVIGKLVNALDAKQAAPSVVAQVEKVETTNIPAPAPVVTVSASVFEQVAPSGPIAAAPQMVSSYSGQMSMPPLPAFVAPVEPAKPAAPFSDPKGMIQYVTESYKALGPTKGAKIQEVITKLGCHNINEIRADQYADLYAGVESLK